MYQLFFKRFVDIVLSLVAIILFLPITILVIIVLIVQNKGKVFFIQPRPGKNLKKINVVKFKSMTDKRNEQGQLLPESERLTRIGRFIRKTSIDELPQLYNVLKGDMSLIGPRPLLFEFIPFYTSEQNRRHNVYPGITGWAQVNGRNSITWTKKFELDIFYVENISFLLDIKILFMTVITVLKKENINKNEKIIAEAFNGKN